MYVCICHAVTESQVNRAVDYGSDTIEAIGRDTRAGTGCGTCHDQLADIIEDRCGSCPLAELVA